MTENRCHIMTLAGTRPELIKLSEFVHGFPDFAHKYVYTGQHFSSNMKYIFLDQLNSRIDIDLNCSSSDVYSIADSLTALVAKTRPSVIVVYGDTNSTLAGAYAAHRTDTVLVHIEAGLRSFDLRMPEERNRIEVDRLSSYLLCPTTISREFLAHEGRSDGVSVTGNLIVDVCKRFSKMVRRESVPADPYILLTLHRGENVDDVSTLKRLRTCLNALKEFKVIFPIHPRTKNKLTASKIRLPGNVELIDPVGYLDFLGLLQGCKLVLTDSGGVQEEAAILGKPCVTLRHTTERWETILTGGNRLYPLQSSHENIKTIVENMLEARMGPHPYGDRVTQRTVEKVKQIISEQPLRRIGAEA